MVKLMPFNVKSYEGKINLKLNFCLLILKFIIIIYYSIFIEIIIIYVAEKPATLSNYST